MRISKDFNGDPFTNSDEESEANGAQIRLPRSMPTMKSFLKSVWITSTKKWFLVVTVKNTRGCELLTSEVRRKYLQELLPLLADGVPN